jgi:uncharacterized membrane protein
MPNTPVALLLANYTPVAPLLANYTSVALLLANYTPVVLLLANYMHVGYNYTVIWVTGLLYLVTVAPHPSLQSAICAAPAPCSPRLPTLYDYLVYKDYSSY